MASQQLEYIGVLGRTHGLDGTLVLDDAIALPNGLAHGCIVHVGFSRDFTKSFAVESFAQTEHRTLMKLRELSTAEQASGLIDHAVFARGEDLGINSSDRYRVGDIQGCRVINEQGDEIGVVTDVWILPANDVWVVTTASRTTIPLPVIEQVILGVDIEHRTITARLLDGLENVDIHEDLEPDA